MIFRPIPRAYFPEHVREVCDCLIIIAVSGGGTVPMGAAAATKTCGKYIQNSCKQIPRLLSMAINKLLVTSLIQFASRKFPHQGLEFFTKVQKSQEQYSLWYVSL